MPSGTTSQNTKAGPENVPEAAGEFSIEYRRGYLVLLQGCPGLGKTTLSKPLAEILSKRGRPAIAIEQDEFASAGKKGSGKRFTNHLDWLMSEGQYEFIISARNNADLKQYKHHYDLAK